MPDLHAGRDPRECQPDATGSCAICGDVAVLGDVRSVDSETATAVVRLEGREEIVALDLVDDVTIGDRLLVHQGFAVTRVAP